jgi:hypothetical protein
VPGRIPAPASGRRGGYRWIARPPAPIRPFRDSAPASRPPGPTPRYREIPRWGLPEHEPEPVAPEGAELTVARSRALRLVLFTGAAFLGAAAAELWRYAILLDSRTELIDPILLWCSDQLLNLLSLLALPLALGAAYTCAEWLFAARADTFARNGMAEPRSRRWILVCCLVPVVNLVLAGVLLTELAEQVSPRLRRVVRVWWCGWVVSAAMSVISLLWHFTDTLQARANGVVVSAVTDLVAAALAVATLWLIRETQQRDLLGRGHVPTRRVLATGPGKPVIEPIATKAETGSPANPAPIGPVDKDGDADRDADKDEEVLTT